MRARRRRRCWRSRIPRARCTSARSFPTPPDVLPQRPGAGLGGYVLCGITPTRRGDGLLADVRRADCQVLVTDATHRLPLDGLDLTGIRLIDVSSDEWRRHLD